ncbi:AMP-dependent synthetase/ligase [Pseudobacteroides cellulosolvens]|uniref:Long-chain-fatty-acid--CoA ligase n=2 Tax=Pseudobacteroides cellulosolvens TaxID=35825 RepID=A0A0L6JTQ1_9FIRM|nr:AMP-binding protein [Pseudobacteroides cellulosolvens]KNY29206.1 Long-chain-fatty-acid--CoA ligase [Pseudobacteroides cellulosolvens ATCC 35603 = DSM 2933]
MNAASLNSSVGGSYSRRAGYSRNIKTMIILQEKLVIEGGVRKIMANRNYPLYETTIFEDFRIMTENVAKKYPDRIAISYKKNPRDKDTAKVTYLETRDNIRNMGTELIFMGCRDKHVALIGESSYDWICSYFSLMAIGAVVVPIDINLPVDEIAGTMNTAECEFLFYSTTIEAKIKELREKIPCLKTCICMGESKNVDVYNLSDVVLKGGERFKSGDNSYYDYKIDSERLATIVFTSGTTGKGKGVMLSQKNIVTDMTQGMYNFAISPKTMNVLPPHHTFGSTVNFVGHFSQGSEIYISSGLKYIANEMTEQQPIHLVLVPLFVENMFKKVWAGAEKSGKARTLRRMMKLSNFLRKFGIDLRRKFFKSILDSFGGKLEMIICGGASLNQDIIDTFDAIGITILNGYGITECAPLISCNRNKYQKRGSVGIPIIGELVKIKDPDENGEGEICVKGPNVMLGYYKDPKATAEAFDEEGYFKTGDYGKLDEEGWIYITGRMKNLIILSNGKNVYPEEIENEISRVFGVSEVIVYAGESKTQKEVIVAEIFPDFEALKTRGIEDVNGYFNEEIKKVNGRMVSYKAVKMVKIRQEEFKKNTSKKILRFAIDKSLPVVDSDT